MSGDWPPEWEDTAEEEFASEADEAQLAEVAAYLASVPAPALPDAIEARISAVLVAEATARAGGGGAAAGDAIPANGARILRPIRSRFGPHRRSGGGERSASRVRTLVAAASVAACLLLAGLGYELSSGGGSTYSGPETAAGAPAPVERSAAAAAPVPGASVPAPSPTALVPANSVPASAAAGGLSSASAGSAPKTSGSASRTAGSTPARSLSAPRTSAPAPASSSSSAAAAPTASVPAPTGPAPTTAAPTRSAPRTSPPPTSAPPTLAPPTLGPKTSPPPTPTPTPTPTSTLGRAPSIAFVVIASGTDYQAATLAAQVRAKLSAPGGTGATPSAALRGCVSSLTGGAHPQLVDQATYQGAAAYIIATSSEAWVVGLGCTAANPELVTSVPLAGLPGNLRALVSVVQ